MSLSIEYRLAAAHDAAVDLSPTALPKIDRERFIGALHSALVIGSNLPHDRSALAPIEEALALLASASREIEGKFTTELTLREVTSMRWKIGQAEKSLRDLSHSVKTLPLTE